MHFVKEKLQLKSAGTISDLTFKFQKPNKKMKIKKFRGYYTCHPSYMGGL
jgi:hypothetical protein